MVRAFSLAIILTAFALNALAQDNLFRLNAGVTIRQKIRMTTPEDGVVDHEMLVAFRRDGSRVTARQMPHLKATFGFHVRVIEYPELGQRIIVNDVSRTQTASTTDAAWMKSIVENHARKRASNCVATDLLLADWERVVGEDSMFGYPVVKLWLKTNGVTSTRWLAPSLDCTELASRAEYPDGAVISVTTTEIVSGDPDPALFWTW